MPGRGWTLVKGLKFPSQDWNPVKGLKSLLGLIPEMDRNLKHNKNQFDPQSAASGLSGSLDNV